MTLLWLGLFASLSLTNPAIAKDKAPDKEMEELVEGPITVDAYGVPLQVPVRMIQKAVQLTEETGKNNDIPSEGVSVSEHQARMFFSLEPSNRTGVPSRYIPVLQKAKQKENVAVLEPIPTSQLRTLYHRVNRGEGTTVMVEIEPGLFAPATYEDLLVDISGTRARYYPTFNLARLEFNSFGKIIIPTQDYRVALADAEDRVYPLAPAFREIPEQPEDQKYFVQIDLEKPLSVLVLGLEQSDANNPLDTFAYVVLRRALETGDESPTIYRLPFGALRTTYAAAEAKLLRESRAQEPNLEGLSPFEYKISITLKTRSFSQGFRAMRSVLGAVLEQQAHRTLLFTIPCSAQVAAAG